MREGGRAREGPSVLKGASVSGSKKKDNNGGRKSSSSPKLNPMEGIATKACREGGGVCWGKGLLIYGGGLKLRDRGASIRGES